MQTPHDADCNGCYIIALARLVPVLHDAGTSQSLLQMATHMKSLPCSNINGYSSKTPLQ